jgi:hypothetical protein
MKIRMYIAWFRGATVLQTPDRDGYAALRGSGDGYEEWAERLIAKGWHRWYPNPKEKR